MVGRSNSSISPTRRAANCFIWVPKVDRPVGSGISLFSEGSELAMPQEIGVFWAFWGNILMVVADSLLFVSVLPC